MKYFLYQSDIWRKHNATAIVKHDNGAVAYAAHQEAIWTGLYIPFIIELYNDFSSHNGATDFVLKYIVEFQVIIIGLAQECLP